MIYLIFKSIDDLLLLITTPIPWLFLNHLGKSIYVVESEFSIISIQLSSLPKFLMSILLVLYMSVLFVWYIGNDFKNSLSFYSFNILDIFYPLLISYFTIFNNLEPWDKFVFFTTNNILFFKSNTFKCIKFYTLFI